MLRGIDTSHWKADLNLHNIAFDFIITKATGGNGYVDPSCDTFVQTAISLGKKWGVFHYFGDGFNDNDPIAEANFFVDNCLGYIGKGVLMLDWERGGNPNVNNVGMALAWLNHVHARTGVRPLIYMSVSLITSLDWSPVIAGGYGLAAAQWPEGNNIVPNYAMDPNRDPNPHWDGQVNDAIWQFTSTGRLDGYGGNLDCDFFYGSREAWDAYAKSQIPATTTTTTLPEPTTTTTTTEAPAPEPTTTTTTVEVDPGPGPDPGTTTTTTSEPQPEPSTTTTTTVDGENQPPAGWLAGFLAGIGAFLVWLLSKLNGGQQ